MRYFKAIRTASKAASKQSEGDWAAMRRAHDEGHRICLKLGLQKSWEASFLRTYEALGEYYAGDSYGPGKAAWLQLRTFLSALVGGFIALAMVLAGLGYKVAAVPFHMWCPDVYQGAPTPVTAVVVAEPVPLPVATPVPAPEPAAQAAAEVAAAQPRQRDLDITIAQLAEFHCRKPRVVSTVSLGGSTMGHGRSWT